MKKIIANALFLGFIIWTIAQALILPVYRTWAAWGPWWALFHLVVIIASVTGVYYLVIFIFKNM